MLLTQLIDVHLAPRYGSPVPIYFWDMEKTFPAQPGLLGKTTLRLMPHKCPEFHSAKGPIPGNINTPLLWAELHNSGGYTTTSQEVRAGARSAVAAASSARRRSLAALSSRSRNSSSEYSGLNKYGRPSKSNGLLFSLFSAILSPVIFSSLFTSLVLYAKTLIILPQKCRATYSLVSGLNLQFSFFHEHAPIIPS